MPNSVNNKRGCNGSRILYQTSGALITAFDAAISAGKITTSEKKSGFYTHKAAQWAGEAWFRAAGTTDKLTFNIVNSLNHARDQSWIA